jgi:hypothetical protein
MDSACSRALKQHVVSANCANLALKERNVKSNPRRWLRTHLWLLAWAGRTWCGRALRRGERLQQAWELALRRGVKNPNVFPIAGDLAEALARTGKAERCDEISTGWTSEPR